MRIAWLVLHIIDTGETNYGVFSEHFWEQSNYENYGKKQKSQNC